MISNNLTKSDIQFIRGSI